ncbi:MAG: DUF3488 domain-containing protein [Myxococcales bacterium]|nr:DUF3488 domain-containing protein [Myxococcales bacterium]
MSFERVLKVVTYLIAGLGLYALTLGGTFGVFSMFLVALGFAVSWFAEPPLIATPAWTRGWTIAAVGFFVVQVLRGITGASILELALEYVAMLQVSRLMNRRTGKDHNQITVLAFLHLIAATVLTTSVAYGLVFIGVLIVTPWMLTITQLRRELEETVEIDPVERARLFTERDVVGSRFLLTTALLTLPIFFVTLALFLLFPRVGLGFAAVHGYGGQPTTGFGRNVELGGFGTIREDPTVVLRVSGPAELLGPPGTATLRMRGTSFDKYNGREWERSESNHEPIPSEYGSYPIVRFPDRDRDFELKVVLDHLDEPVVFVPDGAVAIATPPRLAGGGEVRRRIVQSRGFDFRYDLRENQGLNYSVFVSRDRGEWTKGSLLGEDVGNLTQVPSNLGRVGALASELTADAATDRERAERIVAYLRDSNTFRYSLTLPKVEGRDPLEVFLFEARYGHCEYFSTAAAMMLRTQGIPTRNVSGFLGGSYNRYGDYYALRRADAHSWVEAWIDNHWVTLDPTPPARNAVGPARTWFSPIRDFLDAARTRWSKQVVGYDLRTQTNALRKAFRFASTVRNFFRGKSAHDTRGNIADTNDTTSNRSLLVRVAIFGFVLLALALMVFLVRRFRRSAREREAIPPQGRAAVRVYHELESALERRGVPREPGVTPLEHLEHLEGLAFDGVDDVREVTQAYVRARFGRSGLSPADLARLRASVRRVARGTPVAPGMKTP